MACRGYLCAAAYLGASLQPPPAPPPAPPTAATSAPPTPDRPWVCEAGVMGFGGVWARVRVVLDDEGWVSHFSVLEFFPH